MSLPWSYAGRLARDLERWRNAGYIDERAERLIRADVNSRGGLISLPSALAILGAVLIGFSAMTFVAANWQEMSRLARLLLLALGMWGANGLAAMLFDRGRTAFAHAAVLAGAAIFGASIMLVAQMYHMDGNPPDAVLLWLIGALAAGFVFRSGPALGLAMLLVGLWSGWEMALTPGVHLPFLIGWGAVAGTILWLRWRPGLHLSALVMAGWIVALGDRLPHGPHYWLVAAIGFAIAGAAMAAYERWGGLFEGRLGAIAPTAANYGLALGFIGLLMMQFARSIPLPRLTLLAIASLVIVIAVMAWAMRMDNRTTLRIAYAAFSAEILALYFKTLGTLIDTSLFFALTGVFVIALASIGYRLIKTPATTEGAQS